MQKHLSEMIKFCLIFSLCVVGSYCAISIENTIVPVSIIQQGYTCKSSQPDVGYMVGGEVRINYKPGFCGRVSCDCYGTVTTETCGIVAVPVGCRVIRDMCQPYPGCCPRVVCPIREPSD